MTTDLSLTQLVARMTQVKPNLLLAETRTNAAAVHGGAGLSDLTIGGAFTAVVDHTYVVKITTAAGTDKFSVSIDGGAFGAEVSLTGSSQTLANGLTITFAATTGHTLNDTWTIVATAGTAISASTLMNLAQIAAGTASTLYLYDGQGTPGTPGTLIYEGATANWAAGRNDYLGYKITTGVLYAVMAVTTTAASLIIGTN